MKKILLLSLFVAPLCVFSQTRIDISSCFVNDSSKVSHWFLNGKRINSNDFPIFVVQTNKNRLDTIVFAHGISTKLKYDTVYVCFPQKSNLMLVPDNDGSFDIIHNQSRRKHCIKAKFVVQNVYSDTIICCYSSETALVGQIFTKSSSSGWLKPFTTPYQSNIIHVCVFKAKQLDYYALKKEDALFFGDKNCSIIGWDSDQLSHLSKVALYNIRLFKAGKIFIIYDNKTNSVKLSISKKQR